MNVLIVEDEFHAARMLSDKLTDIRSEIQILSVLDSVKSTLNWVYHNELKVDLIFLDIELADGNSFEIFKHAELPADVIFVTAYNQYAVEAFRVNAIDYLLKPIEQEQLEEALLRWEKREKGKMELLQSKIEEMSSLFAGKKKRRCLVKKGGSFEFINVSDIAMAYSEDSVTFLLTYDGQRHLYSRTIEQLLAELDPQLFFQINRGQLVNVANVQAVHPYLGQRLKLLLKEKGSLDDILVSRQRASAFKHWLDS